jgi:hypothetical protein
MNTPDDASVGGSDDRARAGRRSPRSLFPVVWFVLGGGLWALWSPWGAVLVILALASMYAVARALTSSTNLGTTRASLDKLMSDVTQLRTLVDQPDASSDARLAGLVLLRDRGLITAEEYDARRAQIID